MTLPNERRMAVLRTQDFLRDLLDPKKTKVPKEIRERAYACLKHFPAEYHMDKAKELAPTVFGEWDSEYKTEEHSKFYYDFDRNK